MDYDERQTSYREYTNRDGDGTVRITEQRRQRLRQTQPDE
jgi:hypothetical protein